MTGSTNVGDAKITTYAWKAKIKENGKAEIVDDNENNNNLEFKIVPGTEIEIGNLKSGATPELEATAEYKNYKNNVNAMVRRYKGKKVDKTNIERE